MNRVGISRQKLGFTIVELLIVVVVIAILAAITIVAYNGIQNRAKDSAARSAVSQINKKMSTYTVTNNETYPADKNEFLSYMNFTETSPVTYSYITSSDLKSYCASLENSSNSFVYATTATSNGPVAGSCVTNFAINGTFDNGATGWSNQWWGNGCASGVVAVNSTGGAQGGNYYRKQWTAACTTNTCNIGITSPSIAITAGETYRASSYFRFSHARPVALNYNWFNSAGTSAGSYEYMTNLSTINTWMRLDGGARVAPAGAVTLRIALTTPSNNCTTPTAAGETLDFDGLMVTRGAQYYDYGEGTSTAWAWVGAPNTSAAFGPAVQN